MTLQTMSPIKVNEQALNEALPDGNPDRESSTIDLSGSWQKDKPPGVFGIV